MANGRASNQQKIARAKNLRPKYDLNGRKMTIENGKARVYERKDSRGLLPKKNKGTVFQKIMNKFNHNVGVGEGLIGG